MQISRVIRALWVATVFSFLALSVQADPYRLQVGDKISITVAGLPELDRVLEISTDGTAAFPLIGRVPAADQNIEELEKDVAQRLSHDAVIRQRAEGGTMIPFAVEPAEVSLTIDTYVPVYVSGDVATPGRHEYAPGLTARRALALAGGLRPSLLNGEGTAQRLADLAAQEATLSVELTKAADEVARLTAMLEYLSNLDGSEPGEAPVTLNDPVQSGILESTLTRIETERAGLDAQADSLRNEIQVLGERVIAETEGAEIDDEAFARVRELYDRGLASADRLGTARRSVLLSSTRQLETATELAARQRELVFLEQQISSLNNTASLDALLALADAITARDRLQAELRGVRDLLLLSGQAIAGIETRREVQIVIERPGGEEIVLEEGEDAELYPGDLLIVELSIPQSLEN